MYYFKKCAFTEATWAISKENTTCLAIRNQKTSERQETTLLKSNNKSRYVGVTIIPKMTDERVSS